MEQDAHEFLNFLLNELVDILVKEAQAANSNSGSHTSPEKVVGNGATNGLANGNHKEPVVTWVHKIFQVWFFNPSVTVPTSWML